jgi:hypothetical protein
MWHKALPATGFDYLTECRNTECRMTQRRLQSSLTFLSTISRTLEKLISIQLINHLDLNNLHNLLFDHQYGFKKQFY